MTANHEPRSTNVKCEAQMTANREPRSTNEKREAQMTANREPRTKNANVPLGHGTFCIFAVFSYKRGAQELEPGHRHGGI